MKKVKTTQGRAYVVTAVTVPCRISSNGIELALVEAVGQVSFVAIAEEIDVSQDDAVITPVFKGARLGLSAKGGMDGFYITVDEGGSRRTHNNSKLVNGDSMFTSWAGLRFDIIFDSDPFSSLVSGQAMFESSTLRSFSTPLPALADGDHMFYYCLLLESFTVPLPLLIDGEFMFCDSPLLALFESTLPALVIGKNMFGACIQLESFTVPLPALADGRNMFLRCRLDKPSVLIILNSLQSLASKPIITIGASKACEGDPEIATAITAVQARGWIVQISYNA